ncbi:hypothetical protein [Paenibacillus medicaginis]|uniref:Uncharacterized protein n=1 Tax=Paenibacillus medicaginis TaxID=1470560 RepID=A0ABV5BUG7_9BACL
MDWTIILKCFLIFLIAGDMLNYVNAKFKNEDAGKAGIGLVIGLVLGIIFRMTALYYIWV